MKKLILLSVIFALAAGSVFAVDVSLEVQGGASLVKGSSKKTQVGINDDLSPKYETPDNTTAFNMGRIRIGASGQLEDGTLGGWLRFDGAYGKYPYFDNDGNTKIGLSYVTPAGFVWWQPAKFFKLQIGGNPDGEFGLDGITRWNFYQMAGDVGVASESWAFGSAFFGGWNAPGIILTITPIEALVINLGIPIAGGVAWEEYVSSTLQIKFDLGKIGTVGLTFVGDVIKDEAVYTFVDPGVVRVPFTFDDVNNDSPKLYGFFALTLNENFGLDIGVGYKFPDEYTKKEITNHNYMDINFNNIEATDKKTETFTAHEPVSLGLGLSFKAGSFGLKTRVLGNFAGMLNYDYDYSSTDPDKTGPYKSISYSVSVSRGHEILFDILPYIAINSNFTFYFSAGLGIKGGAKNLYYEEAFDVYGNSLGIKYDLQGVPQFRQETVASETKWHINPYIVISPDYWKAAFFAGFRLESPYGKDDSDKAYVNWGIPIGISVSF